MMKAVMYHYVRGQTTRPPNYYYLDVADFRRQLDYFESEFGFVNRDKFLATVRGECRGVPSGVVLTFDDGLREHYDVVYPELRKRGLWGIFYVPSGPYESGQLLDVHRIHVLLGELSGRELLDHVEAVVEDHMIPHEHRGEYREETYKRQDDKESTKHVKRILNFYVADEYQEVVLDRIADRAEQDPVDVSEFYMTQGELREMHDNGMIIGGHTRTHPVLSKLDRGTQRAEIEPCFEFLDRAVDGLAERTFCYPYGDPYTFNEHTESILDDLRCDWSFKVASENVSQADIENSRQALPRYDCAEFPHGSASGSIGVAEN